MYGLATSSSNAPRLQAVPFLPFEARRRRDAPNFLPCQPITGNWSLWIGARCGASSAVEDAGVAVGELDRTFHSLQQVPTAGGWRRETVEGFAFTLKAWQAVPHPWSSPTWNDHRDDVPDDRTDEVDIDDVNDVGGRQLMRFRTRRKTETAVNTAVSTATWRFSAAPSGSGSPSTTE